MHAYTDRKLVKIILADNSLNYVFLCIKFSLQCNYFIHYVVIIQNSPQSEALSIVSYIGCAISIACLLFTITMLIVLRYVCICSCNLLSIILMFLFCRKKVFSKSQHFVHLNLCFALLFGLILFVSGIEAANEYRVRARTSCMLCVFFNTYAQPYIQKLTVCHCCCFSL